MVCHEKRFSLLNFSASPSAMISPGPNHITKVPPNPSTDCVSSICLSLENHICLSWILDNVKLSTFLKSPHIEAKWTCFSSDPLLVKLSKSRLTAYLNSIVPRFFCPWNCLPEVVLSDSSLHGFKKVGP